MEKDCELDPVSSRACEKGTKTCVVRHDSIQSDIRAEIEKIVCKTFPAGNNWNYVYYDTDDLSQVTIDGSYDLKELIVNLENLYKPTP